MKNIKAVILIVMTSLCFYSESQGQFQRDSLYPFPFTQESVSEVGGLDTFWVYTDLQNYAVEVLIDYNRILKDEIWALMGQDSINYELTTRQGLVLESQQSTIKTLSSLSASTLDRSQDLYERSVVSVENITEVTKRVEEERDQNERDLKRSRKWGLWKSLIIAAEGLGIGFLAWICF